MYEYVSYHINGDTDCNTKLLRKWADDNKLSLQDRFDLSYFFSTTYCIPSAILMLKERDLIKKQVENWVLENKNIIIFQSDRKYVKMLDNFLNCLKYFNENLSDVENFIKSISINGIINIEKALQKVQKWYFFGRFASYLFLETFISLTDYKTENTTIDWQNGDTATSGIMNLFGLDNSANYFDSHDKIPDNLDYNKLNQMLEITLKKIREHGGDDNVTFVETSLCAYRKLYKGSRYNGYYLDRQLEEIHRTNKLSEKYRDINNELLMLRKNLFNSRYLGELNNWKGIRKECKKMYKEKGIML